MTDRASGLVVLMFGYLMGFTVGALAVGAAWVLL